MVYIDNILSKTLFWQRDLRTSMKRMAILVVSDALTGQSNHADSVAGRNTPILEKFCANLLRFIHIQIAQGIKHPVMK